MKPKICSQTFSPANVYSTLDSFILAAFATAWDPQTGHARDSFTKILDHLPFKAHRGRVMTYVWNWIAFVFILIFCAHSAFQSYKQWRSESRIERSGYHCRERHCRHRSQYGISYAPGCQF